MNPSPKSERSTTAGADKKDPGAARFGNFINYYEFNPPENRLSLLPPDLISSIIPFCGSPVTGLDVGCNAGNLTQALLRRYGGGGDSVGEEGGDGGGEGVDLRLLGVDIDPQLIARAQQSRTTQGEKEEESKVEFLTLDLMDTEEERVAETLNSYLLRFNTKQFDVVFVFSVTMWIHLHHGDAGLERFLRLVGRLGRHVLIEPQPWKCYQTATKRANKLQEESFPHWKHIQLRGEKLEPGILKITSELGWNHLETFGETKWKRKLWFFRTGTV